MTIRKMVHKYWLMKTEPSVFSFEDLIRSSQKTTAWEGVRNYQARNFMRDEMRLGDKVFVYHSNSDILGIMGTAEIVREAYPDESVFDPKSRYFDDEAFKKNINPWVLVNIRAISRFLNPVTRDRLKKEPALAGMMVLKKGSRLSIQPVAKGAFLKIIELGEPVIL